jgi:hypothetical protein
MVALFLCLIKGFHMPLWVYILVVLSIGINSGLIDANSVYEIYADSNILFDEKEVAITIVASGLNFGVFTSSLVGSIYSMFYGA